MAITTRLGTPVRIVWRHDDYEASGWVQVEDAYGLQYSAHLCDLRAPGGVAEIDRAARGVPLRRRGAQGPRRSS